MSLLDRIGLWALRQSEARTVDGIRIVDMRDQAGSFYQAVEQALTLIRENDLRRYRRVTRHIKWIVNHFTAARGADYHHRMGLCTIEFLEIPSLDSHSLAAIYACIIVHEATHGDIAARGIAYTPQHRSRIERLCVVEHNRFAARLAATNPARFSLELLRQDFDEADWQEAWDGSRFKASLSWLWRSVNDKKSRTNRL